MSDTTTENATFYSFKGYSLGRKYYTTGRGNLPKITFAGSTEDRLAVILQHNDGKWPGLNGSGDQFFRVVVGDESTDHGWPLMFDPTTDLVIDETKTRKT